jgi:CelD/BcsL family acetyltransferase involved in cellulose biosynthesis
MTVASGTLELPAGTAPADVVQQLDTLRDDWTRLADASGNVFATWEWNELWWRHYGRGRSLRIAVSEGDDGECDAIVPLFAWSQRPVRILRLLGHGQGDLLGPICRGDDAGTAAHALRSALAAAEPYDVFVGDWVAGDRGWARSLGGRVVRTTGYPILRFEHNTWDEFLASQGALFRKRARHRRNRLARGRREVTYRSADAHTLEGDLDALFRLHRARFGEHSCNFCGDHEAFQREFARLALERGWLRLLLLEVDGEPVSCEHGFVFENVYFSYQGGRDPAWERESVGFLLELESMRRAREEGIEEYRFLGGEESYKYRFATEDPRLETVVAPATARGRLAAAALHAAWRFPVGEAFLRRVGSSRAGE